jgi:hypothetical protein
MAQLAGMVLSWPAQQQTCWSDLITAFACGRVVLFCSAIQPLGRGLVKKNPGIQTGLARVRRALMPQRSVLLLAEDRDFKAAIKTQPRERNV